MGTRKHHDSRLISGTVAELEGDPQHLWPSDKTLAAAAAADDETWDKVIEADMANRGGKSRERCWGAR